MTPRVHASDLRALPSTAMRPRSVIDMALTSAIVAGTAVASADTASAAPRAAWEKIAQCESGGDWNINTGNGYHGGLQFALATWHGHGGKGRPENASKDEQIRIAERVLATQGWGAWPVCSRKAGLRR